MAVWNNVGTWRIRNALTSPEPPPWIGFFIRDVAEAGASLENLGINQCLVSLINDHSHRDKNNRNKLEHVKLLIKYIWNSEIPKLNILNIITVMSEINE